MIDAPDSPQGALTALGIREAIVVVELPSMVVVFKENGDVAGIQPSSVNSAVAEILRLLGAP